MLWNDQKGNQATVHAAPPYILCHENWQKVMVREYLTV
jgi:hypothetical protein